MPVNCIRSLAYTSPVIFDVFDTETGTVYQHEFALKKATEVGKSCPDIRFRPKSKRLD